jgi:hypothetical protein
MASSGLRSMHKYCLYVIVRLSGAFSRSECKDLGFKIQASYSASHMLCTECGRLKAMSAVHAHQETLAL